VAWSIEAVGAFGIVNFRLMRASSKSIASLPVTSMKAEASARSEGYCRCRTSARMSAGMNVFLDVHSNDACCRPPRFDNDSLEIASFVAASWSSVFATSWAHRKAVGCAARLASNCSCLCMSDPCGSCEREHWKLARCLLSARWAS